MKVSMPSGNIKYKPGNFVRVSPNIMVNDAGVVKRLFVTEGTIKEEVLEIVVFSGMSYVKIPGFLNVSGVISSDLVPLIEVVALGFKPTNLPISKYHFYKAFPIDGDWCNVKPENIVRVFKGGKLETPFTGFFYIPGFTNYGISVSGEVINLSTSTMKEVNISSIGYPTMTLGSDVSNLGKTIQLGRALALTFKRYPRDVRRYVVNHIDNNKGNSSLDNLEWVTQSENVRHGIEHRNKEGKVFMYKSNSPRKVKRLDMVTGKIDLFHSLTDAAVFTGVLKNSVDQSVLGNSRVNSIGLVGGKYIFRYEEEGFPEMDTEQRLSLLRNLLKTAGPRKVVVSKDGVSKTFDSASAFIKESGLSKKVVTTRLASGVREMPDNSIAYYKDLEHL